MCLSFEAYVFPYMLADGKVLCTVGIKLFKNVLTIIYFNRLIYNFLTISFLTL